MSAPPATGHDRGMSVSFELVGRERSRARPGTALRVRLRNFVYAWRESLASCWDAEHAILLHEELELIAAESDQAGLAEIAEPALELAVYLCSFIDGIEPSEGQWSAIRRQVAVLESACGLAPQAGASQKPAARVVVYACPPARAIAGLAAALGREGYVLRPCADEWAARASIEQQRCDVLLVDASCAEGLPRLLGAADRYRSGGAARPIAIAVGQNLEPSVVRYARRVGADAVVDSADAAEVAQGVASLYARLAALDYRVLVVEDDASQALYAQAILRHRGIASHVVSRGDAVLPAIAEFRPDLVLLDLYLPDLNGIEVAQLVRERPEHALLPIVFVSGEQDLDRRFDAIRIGGDDFVTKPVRPRHLVATVEGRLRLARERAARAAADAQGGAGERRGALLAREAFAAEFERAVAAREDGVTALVLAGPHDWPALERAAGFVGAAGIAQRLGVALSASSDLARPACAASGHEFLALARAVDEAALRDALPVLARRLEARIGAGARVAPAVEVRIAAVGLEPGATLDEALARVRRCHAEIGGAERCRYSPREAAVPTSAPVDRRRERAIALVRAVPTAVVPSVEHLDVQALSGALSGRFDVRYAMLGPAGAAPRLEIARDEWLALAREAGVVARREREALRGALRASAARMRADPEARGGFEVSIESVLDPAFAPWLAAELHALGVAPGQVACRIAAGELAAAAGAAEPALERLQIAGVRVDLDGLVGAPLESRLTAFASIDSIRIAAADGAPIDAARAAAIDHALVHGKLVVVAGAVATGEVASLLRHRVHYLASELLSPWTAVATPDAEAPAARRRGG